MQSIENQLRTAIKAALLAGKEILEVYKKEFAITLKEDKSPLTEADRRAHEKILSVLGSELPVLSEEGRSIPFDERKEWKTFWMVDPLDGTKEFIKRNGEFTVNIAMIENGLPVMGVIYAPVIHTLYFGADETGSWKIASDDEYILNLLQNDTLDHLFSLSEKLPSGTSSVFTVVASRSHMTSETESLICDMRKMHGEISLVSKGSSLKLCLVAEGTANVYPRFAPTMEWDTAAGHAIAKFAGCSVNNAESGTEMIYNKKDLLNPWFIVENTNLKIENGAV